MPPRRDEAPPPAQAADSASNSLLQRTIARTDPVLQHKGVIYTFIFIYFFLNLVIFFVRAAPTWRKGVHLILLLRAAETIARGGGAMINFNAALIILVASRNLITYLRQTVLNVIIPFDEVMPAFHSLIGNCLVFATGVHVFGNIIRYSILRLRGPGLFGPISLAVSGSLLTVILLAMRITSMDAVRRKSFETFYWVHSIGAVTFFILIIMHGSHSSRLKTYMYVSGPIIIYIIDRIVRLLRVKSSRVSIMRNSVVIKSNDIICLRIPRTFSYLAGQYCEIKVPLVSQMQWHPFTIASSPHESEMLFYIKASGDWARRLYALFQEREVEMENVQIDVRGPYGTPAQHVGQFEHIVLISGGVGATPFASIAKYAHHWILNNTNRGAASSNIVPAALTGNRSLQGKRSLSSTPPLANSEKKFEAQRYGHTSALHAPRSSKTSQPRVSGSFQRKNISSFPLRMQKVPRDDAGIGRFLEMEASTENAASQAANEEFLRPENCGKETGNQDCPLADPGYGSRTTGALLRSKRNIVEEVPAREQMSFERTTECNSSRVLFDEEEQQVEEESPVRDVTHVHPRGEVFNGRMEEGFEGAAAYLDACGLEEEDQIMGVQNTASNAYEMLGISCDPLETMKHMHVLDANNFRSSMGQASMNLMEDAIDAALWQDRILFYLHTVTINLVLLWLILSRFFLMLIGMLVQQFRFDQRGLGIFKHAGLNVVDLVLVVLVTFPIIWTVVLEIMVNNVQIFLTDKLANSLDVFVLVPLLFLCIFLHILNMVGVGTETGHVSKLTVVGIWPMVSMLILWRILRTIGSRISLAPYFKSTHGQTKSMDFIYVNRTHKDDRWLIEELLPLADSNIVRFHRFITQEGPKTEPWMLQYEKVPLQTTYSRPDWDDVFRRLVERSKSGTVIGVFFCGPDIMAQMMQQAVMKAMAKSMDNAYRRGYFSKKSGRLIRSISQSESMANGSITGDPGSGRFSHGQRGELSSRSLDGVRKRSMERWTGQAEKESDSSAYGCSVRIVLRFEKFS